jgi:hypothetical protein
MSRGRRSPSPAGNAAEQAPEQKRVAAFLRELARRAEDDPAFAARLDDALHASGLLPVEAERSRATKTARTGRIQPAGRVQHATTKAGGVGAPPPLDPYATLRTGGADGLRAALEQLDLAELRAIVRGCRFDPARISSRWTAKERLIELIVTQTQARSDHGKAFSRV